LIAIDNTCVLFSNSLFWIPIDHESLSNTSNSNSMSTITDFEPLAQKLVGLIARKEIVLEAILVTAILVAAQVQCIREVS
jgi:hypothetical protein